MFENITLNFDTKMNDLWTSFVTHQLFPYQACQRPCQKIKVHVEKILELHTETNGFIELRVFPKVKILRNIASYGIFDLVVEVGSALGLWIGLSVLGIFNIVIDYTVSRGGQILDS